MCVGDVCCRFEVVSDTCLALAVLFVGLARIHGRAGVCLLASALVVVRVPYARALVYVTTLGAVGGTVVHGCVGHGKICVWWVHVI